MFVESNFDKNLKLTRSYCNDLLQKDFENRASVLRTIDELETDGKKIFDFKIESENNFISTDWKLEPLYNIGDLLLLFINEKKQKISILKDYKIDGRILLTYIDDILNEGFCEVVSKGFVDIYDLPPTDTWFYFDEQKRILYSWIPQKFVSIIDEIIPCSSTDVYDWQE